MWPASARMSMLFTLYAESPGSDPVMVRCPPLICCSGWPRLVTSAVCWFCRRSCTGLRSPCLLVSWYRCELVSGCVVFMFFSGYYITLLSTYFLTLLFSCPLAPCSCLPCSGSGHHRQRSGSGRRPRSCRCSCAPCSASGRHRPRSCSCRRPCSGSGLSTSSSVSSRACLSSCSGAW